MIIKSTQDISKVIQESYSTKYSGRFIYGNHLSVDKAIDLLNSPNL
ncbi:MAG: hypothetical protein NTX22_12390 [Ignavibacteriales bacterium]|nr:hypothetical protein [Ignavibacteriales bacterium]